MTAAMGFVAVETFLLYRRMLPHEGAALFSVTFQTQFIDRITLYHFIAETAMHVMAAGAFYKAFLDRMM
jgi:hypothetical protein